MALQLNNLEIDLLYKKYYVTIEGFPFTGTTFDNLSELLKEANLITKVKITGYTSNKSLFMSLLGVIAPKSSEIDLSSNFLKEDGIKVADIIRGSNKVKKVDLSSNSLLKHGSKVLSALASESIVDICLANNWIESCNKEVLEKYNSYTSLHRIDLSGNGLDGLVGINSDMLEVIL